MRINRNGNGKVLSPTAREYERQRAKAAVWGEFTDRVLEEAGLGVGMSVLDACCGPGETMRLMERRVGPTGSVTGIDLYPAVGAYGLQRLREEEDGNFHFHSTNLMQDEPVPGAPFDMVFCCFLLIFMDDPVDVVRRLTALTKPGGMLVAMDYDMATIMYAPANPVIDCGMDIMKGTFAAAGRPLDAGGRLGEWFRKAGLSAPRGMDLKGDQLASASGDNPLSRMLEDLAPMSDRLGLASHEEVASLADDIRAISAQGEYVWRQPTVGAAWTKIGD